jgi:deazaflavin-dependent oxidoreductase (nitroreductase family)
MGSKEFTDALSGAREIELTVTGRRSGREISTPVWFVSDGGSLNLLPVNGTDSNWYKNLKKTPKVRLSVQGMDHRAEALPVTDTARVGEVIERFKNKYGAEDIRAYYPKGDVAVEVRLI